MVMQQARHVAWTLSERADPVRFLIRDHDRKFTSSFDVVFEAQGTRVIRTPVHVPETNGIAERFVRTARAECLDWLLIVNAWHVKRALTGSSIITTVTGLTGVWASCRRMVDRPLRLGTQHNR
jgi:putative transposase